MTLWKSEPVIRNLPKELSLHGETTIKTKPLGGRPRGNKRKEECVELYGLFYLYQNYYFFGNPWGEHFMAAVKFLKLEERLEIQRLIKEGVSMRKISKILGRSPFSIRNDISKHGGKDSYDAKKAQRWADTSNDRRKASIKKWLETQKPKLSLSTLKKRQLRISERVSFLEQQMEIIQKLLQQNKGISYGTNKKLQHLQEARKQPSSCGKEREAANGEHTEFEFTASLPRDREQKHGSD